MNLSTFTEHFDAPDKEIKKSPADSDHGVGACEMQIMLSEADAAAWLTSEPLVPAAAPDILMPAEASPAWEMQAFSTRIGNVQKNDGARADDFWPR